MASLSVPLFGKEGIGEIRRVAKTRRRLNKRRKSSLSLLLQRRERTKLPRRQFQMQLPWPRLNASVRPPRQERRSNFCAFSGARRKRLFIHSFGKTPTGTI